MHTNQSKSCEKIQQDLEDHLEHLHHLTVHILGAHIILRTRDFLAPIMDSMDHMLAFDRECKLSTSFRSIENMNSNYTYSHLSFNTCFRCFL